MGTTKVLKDLIWGFRHQEISKSTGNNRREHLLKADDQLISDEVVCFLHDVSDVCQYVVRELDSGAGPLVDDFARAKFAVIDLLQPELDWHLRAQVFAPRKARTLSDVLKKTRFPAFLLSITITLGSDSSISGNQWPYLFKSLVEATKGTALHTVDDAFILIVE